MRLPRSENVENSLKALIDAKLLTREANLEDHTDTDYNLILGPIIL